MENLWRVLLHDNFAVMYHNFGLGVSWRMCAFVVLVMSVGALGGGARTTAVRRRWSSCITAIHSTLC